MRQCSFHARRKDRYVFHIADDKAAPAFVVGNIHLLLYKQAANEVSDSLGQVKADEKGCLARCFASSSGCPVCEKVF